MKEEFVSYEIARKLKEFGFDWECNSFYLNGDDGTIIASERNWNKSVETSSPTLSLAQKWLREVKGIAVNVIAHDGGKWEYNIVFLPNFEETCDSFNIDRSPWCKTYEEALTEGLEEALEILNENNPCP